MAETLIDFMKEIETTEPRPFVAPEIRYGSEEDTLLVYFRTDESYAKWLNDQITVFLSFEGDELVGCQISGLKRQLQSDGPFGIAIKKDGKIELGLFFHLLAYDTAEPAFRNCLVELGQQAKGVEFDPAQAALSC